MAENKEAGNASQLRQWMAYSKMCPTRKSMDTLLCIHMATLLLRKQQKWRLSRRS